MVPDFDRQKNLLKRRFGPLSSYVPELIAVHHDLKQSLQVTVKDADWEVEGPRLQRFCERACLTLEVHERRGAHKAVISKEGLREAPGAGTAQTAGRFFSYPRCCVDAYRGRGPRTTGDDFANRLGELVGSAPDSVDFRMNPFLRTSPFHLYKHFPCSLHCEATLALAETLLRSLHETMPELEGHIRVFGSAPVLFTDVCGAGLSLAGGVVDEQRVAYEAVFTDVDPATHLDRAPNRTAADVALFQDLFEALELGDSLRLGGGGLLTVSQDSRTVAELRCPEHLVWRLLDFSGPVKAQAGSPEGPR